MDYAFFQQAITRIYGTFGRNVPTPDQQGLIYQRVQIVPDAVMGQIVDKICDEATLPQNMSRAIYLGWMQWLSQHPEVAVKIGCSRCTDGWVWVWRRGEHGRWTQSMVACKKCRPSDPRAVSLFDLEASGAMVMPAGYSGGPLAFDRDNQLGCLWPVRLNAQSDSSDGTVSRVATQAAQQMPNMRRDFARVRHLPERELADAGGWR